MSKTRHLDNTIAMLGGKRGWRNESISLRAEYEVSLTKQGWQKLNSANASSEWSKGTTRITVHSGDRVSISFDGITWKPLNPSARKRLLLQGQS